MENISINERVFWNQMTYGKAMRIKRKHILIGLAVLLIVLPFCNWMIPFTPKFIKSGVTIRYERLIDIVKFW